MTVELLDLKAWWDERANTASFEDVDPKKRAFRYGELHWKCPKKGHTFTRLLRSMLNGPECPVCTLSKDSLASKHPRVAALWHPSQNQGLLPRDVAGDFSDEVWWACPKGHAFERSPRDMVRDDTCPKCELESTSLRAVRPRLAERWHPDKNAQIAPETISADSPMTAWWICPKGHEFTRTVRATVEGTWRCPKCHGDWSMDRIKAFVRSLLDNLEALDQSEIFTLAMQAGVFKGGSAHAFARAISSGKLPKEELEKFLRDEPSKVDQIAQGQEQDDGVFELVAEVHVDAPLKGYDPYTLPANHNVPSASQSAIGLEADQMYQDSEATLEKDEEERLPVIQTKDALQALSKFTANADAETVQFLLDSALAKLWRHAFVDEDAARTQATEFGGTDSYSMRVKQDFLRQLEAASTLELPEGYAFRPVPDGPIAPPLLMQKHVAICLRDKQCFGNWSGMGAGKTLSAVLATRVVGAELTVICCPNAVVDNWKKEVRNAFPTAQVRTKTWEPDWSGDDAPRYLVLNYEMFQQPDSEARLVGFLSEHTPQAMVIDEIHFAKQRHTNDMSRRKRLVQGLRLESQKLNDRLERPFYVLGMSGTPVINELQEGKSLVELITGHRHDDLRTKATVQNCMRLYQKLVTHGTRWQPNYSMKLEEEKVWTDCTEQLDEIRRLSASQASPLEIERELTKARIPEIVKACARGEKTLIYTHYVDGIVKPIRQALQEQGLKVGSYTGQTDDTDLNDFLDPQGSLEVLIASSRVSTGVDGLQHVCSKLVINTLPWTRAEYDQLRGRLWRQGSAFDKIEVIIPVTYADLDQGRWSYCESKLERLEYKKSIADAAVDGQIPTGVLRSPSQAQRDILAWLERLDGGMFAQIERPRIKVPLSDAPVEVERRVRRYGEFTQVNNRWYASHSDKTHERLTDNPEEWEHYHTMYRKLRESWEVVPFEEEIAFWMPREGKVLADFGCGEALLVKELGERHRVYSLDHVAINDDVIACDMAHTPLSDADLDGAIFCLSLMGRNLTDYIREAHRCLKLDGQIHIWEGASRMKNPQQFCDTLRLLGFRSVQHEKRGDFVFVNAFKHHIPPREDVTLTLGE